MAVLFTLSLSGSAFAVERDLVNEPPATFVTPKKPMSGTSLLTTADRYIISVNGAPNGDPNFQVTFRANADDLVIGNAFDADYATGPWTIDVTHVALDNQDVFGNLEQLGRCGWIAKAAATKVPNDTVASTCSTSPSSSPVPRSDFASIVSCYTGCNEPAGVKATRCTTLQEWGNVRPWLSSSTPTELLRTIPNPNLNYQVDWRYVTKDAQWVMVKDRNYLNGRGSWVFVRRSCLSDVLDPSVMSPRLELLKLATPTVSATGANSRLFVQGADGMIYDRLVGHTGNGWTPVGGPAIGGAGAASDGAGNYFVFIRGTDNNVYTKTYSSVTQKWGSWQSPSLGGPASETPAAANDGQGHTSVVIRGSDNNVYAKRYDGGWPANWTPLPAGQTPSAPAAASDGVGNTFVVIRGTDDNVYVSSTGNGTNWTSWSPINFNARKTDAAPAVTHDGQGHVFVFIRDRTDKKIYSSTYDAGWGAWNEIGSGWQSSSGPASFATPPSQHGLFIVGNNGKLYRKNYAGGAWGAWAVVP